MMTCNSLVISVIGFLSLLGTSHATRYAVKYTITDDTCAEGWQNNDFACDSSYHCIDTDAGTVSGTWGMYGMFRGTLTGRAASIEWVNMDRSAGSASWTYAADYLSSSSLVGAPSFLAANAATGFAAGNASAGVDWSADCLAPNGTSTGTIWGSWIDDGKEWHCKTQSGNEYGSYVASPPYEDEVGSLGGIPTFDETGYVGDWEAYSGGIYPYQGSEMERADYSGASPSLNGIFCEFNVTTGLRSFCISYSYRTKIANGTLEGRRCMGHVISEFEYSGDSDSYADSEWPKVWLGVTIFIFFVIAVVFFLKSRSLQKELDARPKLPTSNVTQNPVASSH